MRYLIDGYNLAHQITLPAGQVSPARLAAARADLITLLAKGHGKDAGAVTVVFDTKRTRKIEPEQVIQAVDVRFAIGEQADDLIERLIRTHTAPNQLTVVSDDHRIQSAGRRSGCRVVGCSDYLDELERMCRTSHQTETTPEKPESTSPSETEHWLSAFRDVET